MSIKIITTEDGSHSLYDDELNETYHSTRGARGESMHVFIKEGLEHWTSESEKSEIQLLEIGLGTGLNAFLTALWSEANNQRVYFSSLEPFPISKELYENLNYFHSEKEEELLLKVHESDWEGEVVLSASFNLFKTNERLENFNTINSFDVIYFDAFAPNKQPEVWSLTNLKKCYGLLNPGGVLTTYCAQGQFKRNLSEAGFKVETLQGAMGKKEMVRGIKAE